MFFVCNCDKISVYTKMKQSSLSKCYLQYVLIGKNVYLSVFSLDLFRGKNY